MLDLPSGTVTFLFTDIEGSTRLLHELRDRYGDVLEAHARLLRAAFEEHDGREIDTQGDSFFIAFKTAKDALAAAVAAQRNLAAEPWPDGIRPAVRMGMHTGEPSVAGERYLGLAVHRASRICSAAHGGQILLSGTTADLVADELPRGMSLRTLGEHNLKDFERAERIFQVGAEDFPPSFRRSRAPARRKIWTPSGAARRSWPRPRRPPSSTCRFGGACVVPSGLRR